MSSTRSAIAHIFEPTQRRITVAAAAAAAVGVTIGAYVFVSHCRARRLKTADAELFEGIDEPPLFSATRPLQENKVSTKRPLSQVEANNGDEMESSGVLNEERNLGLQLARDLLRRLHGNNGSHDVSKKNDDDEGDSETTDVSLNYAIATEVEKDMRDNLVEAFTSSKAVRAAPTDRVQLETYSEVLRCAVEYLEVSMERENLRARRRAAEVRRELGLFPSGATTDLQQRQRDAIDAAYAEFFSRPSEMDQRLRAPGTEDMKELLEMSWGEGEEEDDDELGLMAYLDQNDAVGYGNRMEAQLGAMMRNEMHFLDGDDDDAYYDDMEEEDEEELDDNDEDDRLAKAEFERMLIYKLKELAAVVGVTTSSAKNLLPLATTSGGNDGASEEEYEEAEENGEKNEELGDEEEAWETEDEDQ